MSRKPADWSQLKTAFPLAESELKSLHAFTRLMLSSTWTLQSKESQLSIFLCHTLKICKKLLFLDLKQLSRLLEKFFKVLDFDILFIVLNHLIFYMNFGLIPIYCSLLVNLTYDINLVSFYLNLLNCQNIYQTLYK